MNGLDLAIEVQPVETELARHARERGDHVALVSGGLTLRYAELEARVAAFADELTREGIGRRSIVALRVPPSVDLVVAMLACARVHAAFLALDPGLPPARLEAILQDAKASASVGPSLALTRHATGGSPELAGDPAYVIYTSGTTGSPKGVVIGRTALRDHLDAIVRTYRLVPEDRVLQFASSGFDVAIEEIFGAIVSGATLVLRDPAQTSTFREFEDEVTARSVSVLNLPTAFWQAWVAHLHREGKAVPPALRLVVIGTEQVATAAVERWRAVAGECRLLNCYGPTEATVGATCFEVPRIGPLPRRIPIGRPLARTRVRIVDIPGHADADAGVGELWIGGERVALGYLGRPKMTEARFVTEEGVRWYRTGDLARITTDGQLEFLGRTDRQIKVRGFRIEPQEIEAAVLLDDAVFDVAVTSRETADGTTILATYVVDSRRDAERIREACRERLPSYMVPELVVFVERIPRKPSGKLDEAALPVVEPGRSAHGERQPTDPLERELLAMWRAVLESPVGVNDDFFACGGHSLRAADLVARVEHRLGQRVSLSLLVEAPTVRAFAGRLRTSPGRALDDDPRLVIHRCEQARATLFHIGGAFLLRPLADLLAPEVEVCGVLEQLLDEREPLLVDVPAITRACLEAIVRRQPEGPYRLAGLCFGGVIALEVARALQAQGHDVESLTLIESYGPQCAKAGLSQRLAQLRHHGAELSRREGIDKARYITEKITHKLWEKLWPPGFQFLTHRGIAPPRWLRKVELANLVAANGYRAQPYEGRVVLLRAKEHPFWRPFGANMGWGELLRGPVEEHEVSGDHIGLYDPPGVADVARHLRGAREGGDRCMIYDAQTALG